MQAAVEHGILAYRVSPNPRGSGIVMVLLGVVLLPLALITAANYNA